MKISTVRGIQRYLKKYSGFSGRVINDVIFALGYHPLIGKEKDFKELSKVFFECAEDGAKIGFKGFKYSTDTIPFFQKNRNEIVIHMELAAAEMGTDIFSMVQNFGIFNNTVKPTAIEIGKALWDTSKTYHNLKNLYNVFAWYVLEVVSQTWYRYLEENPVYRTQLAA